MMHRFLGVMSLVITGSTLFAKRIQPGFAVTKMMQLVHLLLISISSWRPTPNLKGSMIVKNMKKLEDLKTVFKKFDNLT